MLKIDIAFKVKMYIACRQHDMNMIDVKYCGCTQKKCPKMDAYILQQIRQTVESLMEISTPCPLLRESGVLGANNRQLRVAPRSVMRK